MMYVHIHLRTYAKEAHAAVLPGSPPVHVYTTLDLTRIEKSGANFSNPVPSKVIHVHQGGAWEQGYQRGYIHVHVYMYIDMCICKFSFFLSLFIYLSMYMLICFICMMCGYCDCVLCGTDWGGVD